MLQQDRVHALRQTHSAVTTLMPLITAGLTVTGALIAAIETRRATDASDARDNHHEPASGADAASPSSQPIPSTHTATRARRPGSIRRFIATLAGRLLLVLLGFGLVLAIILAATSTGRVGQAVTITALILLTLYLAEKVARQA